MDLTISLVNYNTKNLVAQSVKNIISKQFPFNYQIIIIDNNSKDGSADFIEKHIFPKYNQVKLVRSSKNLGFGNGYNYGLRDLDSRYLLLVNADIIIQDNSIIKMYQFMEENKRCGIVGPKLTYPDLTIQRSFHSFPKLLTPLFRRTPLGETSFGLKELKRYDMVQGEVIKPIRVDWVVGACMFIRKSVWDNVGGFDKRYFLYYEDIDICRSVWQKGYEIWYYPYTKIFHFHRRLSAKKEWWRGLFDKTTRIHLASHIKYFRKWGVKNYSNYSNYSN